MNTIFSKDIYTEPFTMFSTSHILALIIICLINAGLIIFFRKYRSSNNKFISSFRYYLATFMLMDECSYILWSILSGDWSIDYSLPLQLCEIITFLSAYMLLSESYTAFELTYFLTFGGALQAILTPDLYYPFPHYRFFNFFISHGLMFIAVFYMLIVKEYRPKPLSILKTMLGLNLYMAILIPINIITGGNYMFLCAKPVDGSILDFLGPWPWYLVSLEAVGLIILGICYLPFMLVRLYNLKSVLKNNNAGMNNMSLH